jgi:hypothetical protein
VQAQLSLVFPICTCPKPDFGLLMNFRRLQAVSARSAVSFACDSKTDYCLLSDFSTTPASKCSPLLSRLAPSKTKSLFVVHLSPFTVCRCPLSFSEAIIFVSASFTSLPLLSIHHELIDLHSLLLCVQKKKSTLLMEPGISLQVL